MRKIGILSIIILYYLCNIVNAKSNDIFPAIMAVSGTKLNQYEKVLLKEVNPYGIILWSKNIESKEQLLSLKKEIETLLGRKILFFMDQEGGRVDRLKKINPHKKYHSPYYFNNIATKNLDESKKLLYMEAKETAKDLKSIGIDVNLGLILDVLDSSDDIENGELSSEKTKVDIGDRSFSSDPNLVKELSKVYIKAYNDVGVDVCAKHFIGLGPSRVNTHNTEAIITKSLNELNEDDLIPFRNLEGVKYGMVSHAVYTAIDAKNPAPFSKKVINFIKNDLGFNGILISDATNMKALGKYTFREKISGVLNSGIDLVLIMEIVQNQKQLEQMLNDINTVKNKLKKV